MHRAKRKVSLKKLFLILSLVVILLIFVELLYLLSTSFSLFDRYQLISGQSTLNVYSQSIERRLQIVNTYMSNILSSQNEIQLMVLSSDARTKFNARKSVSGTLSTMLQLEPMAGGALCWIGNETVMVNSANTMVINSQIKETVLNLVAQNETESVNRGWNWFSIHGQWYLVNIRRYQSAYIAVWMQQSILNATKPTSSPNKSFQFFCQQNGQTIGGNLPETGSRNQNLLTLQSEEGNFLYCCFSLAMENDAAQLLTTIIIICLSIALTVFLAIFLLRRFVHRTLKEVQHGLIVKADDLTQPLANTGLMLESDDVFKTLDDMADRIAKLQNNLYQHEINEQKARLQALHMQINSHFFGNCMNIIFSLAEAKATSLIQEFCIYLIDYLQYINTAFLPTTPLEEELKHLQNYITLQQMRYPGRIVWKTDIQSEAYAVPVLPLMLLTFIENIFKHAIIDEQVCIVEMQAHYRKDGLFIRIEDNGIGIDDALAASLNAFDFNANPDFNQKSGIEKTLARIQLFYNNHATFHIGHNEKKGTGTVIELFLPHEH